MLVMQKNLYGGLLHVLICNKKKNLNQKENKPNREYKNKTKFTIQASYATCVLNTKKKSKTLKTKILCNDKNTLTFNETKRLNVRKT